MAAHVREQFRLRPQIKLLDVLVDSRKAVERIRDLDVDVVIVDTLLKGRVKGTTVIDRIRKAGLPVGIVAITLQDGHSTVVVRRRSTPWSRCRSGRIDLIRGVTDAHDAAVGPQSDGELEDDRRLRLEGRRRDHDGRLQPRGLAPGRADCGRSSSTAASSSATCAACSGFRPTLRRSSTCPPTPCGSRTSPASSSPTRPGSTSCRPPIARRWPS